MNVLNKKRYSLPAKILDLLYVDDSFFNDVMKIKKASSGSKFPKGDEWRDPSGFNMSFALAGYSPEDVSIEVEDNVIIIKGNGLDSIDKLSSEPEEEQDSFSEYKKEGKPRIHIGSISRGIARRKFCVKQLISDEFDTLQAKATMEHGLLHIIIPEKNSKEHRIIEIGDGSDERN